MIDDIALEMHAPDAELEGMRAENEYRFRNDIDGTFGEEAFCQHAEKYRALKGEEHGIDQAYQDVKKFHESFGHPVGAIPLPLFGSEKERRIGWFREEIRELEAAHTTVAQADAIIDLIYFALGYLVEMGVPPSGVWDAVQKANMGKLWADGKAHCNEVGKVVKPDGWVGPEADIATYIQRLKGSTHA